MKTNHHRASSASQVFNAPIRTVSDSWEWITPEEVIKHALAAYYLTCRRMERLADQDRDLSSVDRSVFAGDLYRAFGLMVQVNGFDKGVCEYYSGAAEKLAEMRLTPPIESLEGETQ